MPIFTLYQAPGGAVRCSKGNRVALDFISWRRLIIVKGQVILATLFGLLCAGYGTTAIADAAVTLGESGLRIESDAYHIQFGGRLQLDAVAFDEDQTALSSGFDARRLWLELDAGLSDAWSVRFAYDFAAGVTQDAFVRFHNVPHGVLSVGQFKPQVGLSEQSSNKFLTFNERPSVIRALAPGRALGVGFNTWSPHTTFSIAAYGDAIDGESAGSDPLRVTSRFSFRPIVSGKQVLHFGASVLYQETDDNDTIHFRAKPAASLADTAAVITASIPDNDHLWANGVETAWFRGPISLQGEYLRADVDKPGSAVADGYYLQATLFLGDVTRHYVLERGTFGRPRLNNAQPGIWELGLRYDRFDVSDLDAGQIESWALAATCYVNAHLKLALTLARSDVTDGVAGDETIDAIQGRLQWAF